MPNLKNIQIMVDRSSWAGKLVPRAIHLLPRVRPTNIDVALLHTALWTRPPRYTGFDLSDCWAWLRYQRAFAPTPELRLRPEWEAVDSHQKTVSSDELGIGFTTQLFVEDLGFLAYVDTKYMVEVLKPSSWRLGGNAKRGPSKSPDYIAIDSNLLFSVLECKGTQSSITALNKAVQGGITQKRNIAARGGARIEHSLVAGLFIPQWRNSANATIQVSDPEWEELGTLLSETSQRVLYIAMVQIALAKHFALMGFYSMANALMSLDVTNSNTRQLLNISGEDTAFMYRRNRNRLTFTTDLPLPPHEDHYEGDIRAKARRVDFQIDYPTEQLEHLLRSHDVLEDLYQIALNLRGQQWKHLDTEAAAELSSPFGFSMKLEYIY